MHNVNQENILWISGKTSISKGNITLRIGLVETAIVQNTFHIIYFSKIYMYYNYPNALVNIELKQTLNFSIMEILIAK